MSLSKILSVRPPSHGTQPQSLAEGVDKELTCAICISRYTQPKILPCLHCYCKACLEDMVKKSRDKKNVTCPQCKVTHALPSQGIDGFRTFFTLNNLLELLHVHETSEGDGEKKVEAIKCSSGLDEGPEANLAVARCLTCADYLCESCLKVHQKQKVTRNHVIKTLEEIKQSDKTTGAQSLRKKLHCTVEYHEDQLLKFFCKTCKTPICSDCALVTHKEHDYAYVRDFRREVQKKLEGKVLQVQAKETEFQNHKKYVENLMKISKEAVNSSKLKVNKAIDEQIRALDLRRVQLLAEVQTIHETEVKQISTESESLILSLLRLADSVRFTRQLLDNGDDVEVAAVGDQTEETLTSLAQLTWDKSAMKPSLLRPVFESMMERITNFGAVVRTVQKSDIVISKLPAKVLVGEKIEFDVHLSKDVSERGYSASLEVTTSRPDAKAQVIKIEERSLNSWTVSFMPDISGKHEVTVKVIGAPSVTSTLDIEVQESSERLMLATPQLSYPQIVRAHMLHSTSSFETSLWGHKEIVHVEKGHERGYSRIKSKRKLKKKGLSTEAEQKSDTEL